MHGAFTSGQACFFPAFPHPLPCLRAGEFLKTCRAPYALWEGCWLAQTRRWQHAWSLHKRPSMFFSCFPTPPTLLEGREFLKTCRAPYALWEECWLAQTRRWQHAWSLHKRPSMFFSCFPTPPTLLEGRGIPKNMPCALRTLGGVLARANAQMAACMEPSQAAKHVFFLLSHTPYPA